MAFRRLCAASRGDALWQCRQLALGDRNGLLQINVSNQDQVGSSLLPVPPRSGHFGCEWLDSEQVEVATLDSLNLPDERIGLKLDLEGYEPQALDGAQQTLHRVHVIEIELSLLPSWKTASRGVYREMLDRLEGLGFNLVGVQSGATDWQTGRVHEIDALLERLGPGGREDRSEVAEAH